MKTFFAIVAIALIALVAIGLAQGWINVTETENKTTIEIERDGIQRAAEEAGQETRQWLHEAGKSVEKAGQEMQSSEGVEPRRHSPDE